MIRHIFKIIWNKKGSNALMLLEIFLSFMVLFFVISFAMFNYSNYNVDRGFETKDKWIVYLDDMSKHDSLQAAQMRVNLKNDLLNLDGVEAASMSSWCFPYSHSTSTTSMDEMGFNFETHLAEFDYDFAKVMDLKMVQGRWFTEEDMNANYDPIVVNQKIIEDYFPGQNMIDSIIPFGDGQKIVGVMKEYKYGSDFEPNYTMKLNSIHPASDEVRGVLLKMKPGTTAEYEEQVSNVVSAAIGSSGSTISNMDTKRIRENKVIWVPLIILLTICSFLAINVALGLFGILWYNINKRKAEVGLRRALGAHTTDITKQFILEILILTGFALVIGVFFAIQFPILKIGPLPPSSMYLSIVLSVIVILLIVSACAFYPSLQASRIHPSTALHED